MARINQLKRQCSILFGPRLERIQCVFVKPIKNRSSELHCHYVILVVVVVFVVIGTSYRTRKVSYRHIASKYLLYNSFADNFCHRSHFGHNVYQNVNCDCSEFDTEDKEFDDEDDVDDDGRDDDVDKYEDKDNSDDEEDHGYDDAVVDKSSDPQRIRGRIGRRIRRIIRRVRRIRRRLRRRLRSRRPRG